MPYDPLYYYIARNAYLYQYKDILEYLDDNPVLHKDFTYWFQTLIKTHKEPSYHTVVNKLEELAYKHKIPTMALAYRYKRNYHDAFAGITDAEANAAADEALRQLAAKRARANAASSIPPPLRINVTRSYRRPRPTASPELKCCDVNITYPAVPFVYGSSAPFTLLNAIQSGSAIYNREGNKITLSSIRVKLVVVHKFFPEAVTGNIYGNALRCCLLWDRMPNGQPITYNSAFGRQVQDGTETTGFFDPVRIETTTRFKILKEWHMDCNRPAGGVAPSDVDPVGTTNGQYVTMTCDEYYQFPANKYVTQFTGTANPTTIGNILSGALYLVVVGQTQGTAGTTNNIEVSTNSVARLRFAD